jgi:NADPH:quinone reductase-like Zn-dependent oxidoreductase
LYEPNGFRLLCDMKIGRILKWSLLSILLLLVTWLQINYWTSTNDCDQKAGLPSHPMKVIRYCEFGSPEDVLKLEEIEKPVPNDNQILVRVHAAALNPLDLGTRRPWWIRIITGRRKPKETRLGVDYAGKVEAVGKNVTQFKPGDEVFGGRIGAYGEYVCVAPDRAVMLKPANVTFEQAAAVPVAALTALQGLRDKGHIQPGQKVLVNGASGGVGTFVVQIAKSFGAEVTAVTSTRNVDLVRSIGADHVIDYTKENFTKSDQRYDLIYDLVNNHSFSERRQVLTPNGICVMVGLGGSGWHDETLGRLGGALDALVRSWFVSQKFGIFLANLNRPDLKILADLMESGKITPVIDRTYKLSEVPQALMYLEQGHARGKVVITVD